MRFPAPQPRHFLTQVFTLLHGLLLGCWLLPCPDSLLAVEEIAAAAPGVVESGTPSFAFFGPEALGLQSPPTDLRELPDGRILITNQKEIAIGDGVRWELYHQNETGAGMLSDNVAVDSEGNLFCSISGGFARIEFTEKGRWNITRAAELRASSQNKPAVLSYSESIDGHWYWHNTSGAFARWDLKGSVEDLGNIDNIEHIFALAGSLYVSDLSKAALYRIGKDRQEPVDQVPAVTNNNTITSSTPLDEQHLLVGTNMEGVKIFDGRHLTPLAQRGILSDKNRINDICGTKDGYFAAAVDTQGIVCFDKTGRVIQILDRRMDQRLARIQTLLYSRHGVLWALCNEGVVRIEFPARISHYEQLVETGLSYVEPMRFEGRLWFLANGRVLRAVYNDTQRLVALADQSPPGDFTFTLHARGPRLLACGEEGIQIFRDNSWHPLVPSVRKARLLCRDPAGGDRWLYAAIGEFGWLDFSNGQCKRHSIPAPELSACFASVQDAVGNMWLELGSGRVARIDPAAPELLLEMMDHRNGIPESWAALSCIGGIVRMNCASRFLSYNEQTRRWEDDEALLRRFPEMGLCAGRPMVDSAGRLWISGPDMVRIHDLHKSTPPISLPAEYRPFNFIAEENGVVWMHDRRRFARYDPEMPESSDRPVNALITRVDLPGSGRSLVSPKTSLVEPLPHFDNSLIVHYLAPSNPFGQRVTFEFRLDGLGEQWISTGIIGSTVLNRLKEGDYTLHVRPKVGENYGSEAVLRFSIEPPWYRTREAYLGAGAFACLLFIVLVLLPIQAERRQQQKLQALVAIRTRELKETNEQLRVHVDEARLKAAALEESEDRYRRLSAELEQRVHDRTEELQQRISEVERLNIDLQDSHAETARAAARLQEVNANLLVANHELESFSYSVSHDLRAPLRNITGFMELLAKRVRLLEEKESDRYLDIVVSEARRMAALIDDLLTFSRVGRTEMKMQEVWLDQLIEEAKREMGEDFKGREIVWQVSPLPPVLGDKVLLRQVVINLLSNAVKFTRRQPKAIIEVGVSPMPANPAQACFHVRDNGVGFNPRYIDKLFRVFQRLHTPRDFEGTGIGLANVKRIITRHGGRIWAEGAVNSGATFYFTLKLMPAGSAAPAQKQPPDGASGT